MRPSASVLLTLLLAGAASAQNVPVEEFSVGGLIHPGWAYPHNFSVRMIDGGRNSAREAQLFSCTMAELESRSGRCAALPPDSKIEYGMPVRIDDTRPHRIAEYLGRAEGWRVRDGDLAKTLQGIANLRYVKRSPGQGAIVAMKGINSAQGDFMGLAIQMNDAAGGQAGGDEGMMPIMVYMRDHDYAATGRTTARLEPGSQEFRAHLTSNRVMHDDQAAPRRLLIWTEGPRIPFEVAVPGHNPKPRPPTGGASWKLSSTLAFGGRGLPATTLDVFAHERTDWCATLDATAYQSYGTQYNYVLVSRFDGPREFTTHRLLQGQNFGLYENEYVRGYAAVDHAVGAGHTRGHLIPCSIITGYDTPSRLFSIAPIVDSTIERNTAYVIPSMGSMDPEGIKVTYDFKLGTGGKRTGIMVNTIRGPDNRRGDRAFLSSGRWQEGFVSFDSEVMLHDYHPEFPESEYVFAQLRGSSSWNGHEIQIWYPEPKDRGRARIELPHVPGDSAFVLVTRGHGPPEGPCSEPGLQRYYDLTQDLDYVCSSKKKWKRH